MASCWCRASMARNWWASSCARPSNCEIAPANRCPRRRRREFKKKTKRALSNYSLPSAPLLLLVSDRTRYGDRSLEDIFVPALTGGVNMLEVREPDMNARDLLGESERFRKLALGGVPLVIYDRVDIAVAAR